MHSYTIWSNCVKTEGTVILTTSASSPAICESWKSPDLSSTGETEDTEGVA